MKPIFWLNLYFIFSVIVIIYMIMIYFSNLYACNILSKNSANIKSTSWKW